MPLGDRAAFSVATIERGRLRGRSEEVGRCCQLKVGFLEGIPLDGEALIEDSRFGTESAASRVPTTCVFSFSGEVAGDVNRSIASSTAVSRRGWMFC